MKTIKSLLRFVAFSVLALALPFASAAPTMIISDGINTFTIVDNGPGDSDPTPGSINFFGTIGVWSVIATSGSSKPLSGTPTQPAMDVATSASSTAAGTLTIRLSDDFFGPTSGPAYGSISGGVKGGPGSSITFSTFVSSTNNEFDETTPLTPATVFTTNPFAGNLTGNVNLSSAYALTEKIVINHAGAGNSSNYDAALEVFSNATAALGNFVWNDLNGNGVQDVGEPGIAGVTVKLFRCTDDVNTATPLATMVTGDGVGFNPPLGYYQFSGLAPGCYKVLFVKPCEYMFAPRYAAAGTIATDSDADTSTGVTGDVTLAAGDSNQDVDAGLICVQPVFAGLPGASGSYQCLASVPAPPVVTAKDNCDMPVAVNFQELQSAPGSSCNNTITRTWTATSPCGTVASFTQTILVNDTTAPSITSVPTGSDLGCNPAAASLPTDASVKALVTATDACGTPTVNVTHVDGGTACAPTRTFSITASDACGNTSAPRTVVYTWKADTSAPSITSVPTGSDLGCNPAAASLPTDASVKALVTATDACGTPTVNVTHVDGGTACAPIRTFTVTASDACGNTSAPSTVVYTWKADTSAPSITSVPTGSDLGCNPASASLPTDASVKALVTATDTCSTATVNVTHVDGGTACAPTRTFSITASDACGNTSAPRTVVYMWKADTTLPTLTCPSAVNPPSSGSGSFAYCGYTQGGWGATPNGNNPAMLLKNNFTAVYPSGVEVGIPGTAGYSMKFTTAKAIENYLPAGSTAGALTADATNPATSAAGVFGGQVLALQLNVDFSAAGVTPRSPGPLGGLVLNDATSPLNGKSVKTILALANTALGGGNAGVTIAVLNPLVTNLNEAFDNCTTSAWASTHLLPSGGTPTTTDTSPATTGYATATDNCSTPTITYSDVTSAGTCADGYVITRTWRATDSCGNTATCTQTITVGCQPTSTLTLSCPSVGAGLVGLAFNSSFVASGGTSPYTFSITSGALPSGLTLNPVTGAVTGTPTTAGTFNFTAKVVDSTGGTKLSSTVNCSIAITAPSSGGCTLTIGYYKNHPSAITPLPIYLGTSGGAKTFVVSSQQIGVDVLGQHVYGAPANGITKLYAQLLAAKLNGIRGANQTAVSATISSANTFLATHNYLDWSSLSTTDQTSVLSWHSALDNYNNGITGPGHCGTAESDRPLSVTSTSGSSQVSLSWQACKETSSYKVHRSSTPNGPYTAICNLSATTYTDASVTNGTVCYYMVTAMKSGVDDTDSDEVSCLPAAALPSPWLTKDIGSVVAVGGASYSSGAFSAVGSGGDIWNTADAFRYVYQSASGDCSIVAKVTGVQNTDPWAKAGVMIRESLNADSRNACVFVTPTNGVTWQYRTATGGSCANVTSTGLAAPYWVKVVRVGDTLTAYRSADGSTWVTVGSQTVKMGSSIYIGLAVTSHKEGTLCTGTIQSVTATP